MTPGTLPSKAASVEPEIVAIIGAAVALALQKPHRVLSVEKTAVALNTNLYVLNPWSMEGRFQHFGSHKVR